MLPGVRAGGPIFSPSPITALLCDPAPSTSVSCPGKERKNGGRIGGSCVLKKQKGFLQCSGARILKESKKGKGWSRVELHLFPNCVL